MIAALVIGTLLAVVALAFVLYPVFFGTGRPISYAPPPQLSERESAVAALREIEFDRETGKLSDDDYAELKTRYTRQAILAMREQASAGSNAASTDQPTEDEVEAAVRAFRREQHICPTCGPRPEPDAVYCSNCGNFLNDKCAGCGAPVVVRDARFCINCGNRLAA